MFVNGVFYRTDGTTHGFNVYNGSDDNVMSNIIFNNIGVDTSNTIDGIYVAGDRLIITGCKFSGNIDRYPINIASTADGTRIMNCEMSGITGNVGYINNLGTNTSAIGNYPITQNFDILVASQTTGGYPDIGVPTHSGTRVTTKASYEHWISTGTTNDTDWKKLSN